MGLSLEILFVYKFSHSRLLLCRISQSTFLEETTTHTRCDKLLKRDISKWQQKQLPAYPKVRRELIPLSRFRIIRPLIQVKYFSVKLFALPFLYDTDEPLNNTASIVPIIGCLSKED